MTAETSEDRDRDSDPPVREADVRDALDRVERAASTHGRNYAAGMREARRILHSSLLGGDSE